MQILNSLLGSPDIGSGVSALVGLASGSLLGSGVLSSSTTGLGLGVVPGGVGTATKTELENITSADVLTGEKVLSYLQAIITGNQGGDDSRESLMPSGGFFASAATNGKKYGYTPDCTNGICKKSDDASTAAVTNVNQYGYYFQITKDTVAKSSYIYEYRNYRATETDFYISGKIFVTADTVGNTSYLKGQVRIHSTFRDSFKSAGNMIRVKFGQGIEDTNQFDQTQVILDQDNVAKSGKLEIRYYKGAQGIAGSEDFTKTYDLSGGGSNLMREAKTEINTLNLFTVK